MINIIKLNMKKKIITNILLFLLIFVMIFAIVHTYNINMNLNVTEQKNTIIITGKAEKEVAPDTAKISFYVTKRGKNQQQITNYVNEKTKNTINVLKDLNIKEKDIKTLNYSLRPEYRWKDGKRHFINYRVKQNVQVTIRNLDDVSKVLAKIIEQDVDNLSGPNMFIDDIDSLKDKLRGEAIKDAKQKADVLSKQLGIKIEKIVGFSENRHRPEQFHRKDMMMINETAMGREESVIAPKITPGIQKINQIINITFQIEN